MLIALVLIALIVIPVAELAVIVTVGRAIGVLPTVALLLLSSAIGAALLKYEGRAAWLRFRRALTLGQQPTAEVLDGFLILAGGAFMLAPGFVTDVIGLSLLLPPRRLLRKALLRREFKSRSKRQSDPSPQVDIEGTAVEIEVDALPEATRSPQPPRDIHG